MAQVSLPEVSTADQVVWTLVFLLMMLVLGSVIRLISLRNADAEKKAKRLGSLKSWWVLTICLSLASILGLTGVTILIGCASLLALRELAAMVSRPTHRFPVLALQASVIGYFLMLHQGESLTRLWQFQWMMVLGISVLFLLAGTTEGFVRSAAGLSWGSLILVFGLSHAVLLVRLPEATNPVAGPLGWFLYLVILTESNDISQAIIGRRFGKKGKHPIAPRISPNKTWEGFVGGVLVTVIMAIGLSFLLTPLNGTPVRFGSGEGQIIPGFWGLIVGVLVATTGFFGDINMSALKRDSGIKDSSQLFPGMGGMIDRIDSLTFTAPAFYYFVVLVNGQELS